MFSLHVMLIVGCICYLIIGALVFERLEGEHLAAAKANHTRRIAADSAAYRDRVWTLIHDSSVFESAFADAAAADATHDRAAVVGEIVKRARPQFDAYVQTTFSAHRAVRHGFEENAPRWDFTNSLFFTTTMLTSIGFGYVCPSTYDGRLFAVVYCLVGECDSRAARQAHNQDISYAAASIRT